MHREYLKEHRSGRYQELLLSGKLWTYLADLNGQAQARFEVLVIQMKDAEQVTEDFKRRDWLGWLRAMNSIRSRTEEIVCAELIYL